MSEQALRGEYRAELMGWGFPTGSLNFTSIDAKINHMFSIKLTEFDS